MTNEYHIRALRLLAEDARLTDRMTDLLAGLILMNPVALRGEPTMMPCAELMGILGIGPLGNGQEEHGIEEMAGALGDMVQARWSLPSRHGFTTGSFLDSYQVSSESGFLHFQINGGFIRALEKIIRHLARNDGSAEGRH